jgi:hypothetical protein
MCKSCNRKLANRGVYGGIKRECTNQGELFSQFLTELDFRSYIELISIASIEHRKNKKIMQRLRTAIFNYNKRFNKTLNGCIMQYYRNCNSIKYEDFLKFVGKYKCSNKKNLIRSVYNQSLFLFKFERFKYIFSLSYTDSVKLYSDFSVREDVEETVIPVLSNIIIEYLYE